MPRRKDPTAPRRKPGPPPSSDPKRTARLVVQVFPAEYEQVLAATRAAGFTNYADYIRRELKLDPVTPHPTPTGDRATGAGPEGD